MPWASLHLLAQRWRPWGVWWVGGENTGPHMGVSKNRDTGIPQNRWFTMEHPIKIHDLGLPLFLETPILNLRKDHLSSDQLTMVTWRRGSQLVSSTDHHHL